MGRPHDRATLEIPYCKGDSDGLFTNALVAEIEKRDSFTYVNENARYILQVKILDRKSNTIGYRYNPEKLKKGKFGLIPNEGRLRILALVEVIDPLSKKIIIGPAHIEASCEYDHDNYTINHDVNRFSLGQLSDIDTTNDVVDIPLYRNLAKNIANYLELSLESSSKI